MELPPEWYGVSVRHLGAVVNGADLITSSRSAAGREQKAGGMLPDRNEAVCSITSSSVPQSSTLGDTRASSSEDTGEAFPKW